MSIVQKLTEGIVNRDLSAEGAALISKWEQTPVFLRELAMMTFGTEWPDCLRTRQKSFSVSLPA